MSEEAKEALMYRLIQGRDRPRDPNDLILGFGEIEASGDLSFVPVLIELIQVPLSREEYIFNDSIVVPVLEGMTGQRIGYDAKAWVEWLVRQPNIKPPDVYLRWKVELLSQFDAGFKDYFIDPETGTLYPPEKIRLELPLVVWGGVGRDDGTGRSIPALVNPSLVSGEQAAYMKGTDRVFGVSLNGDSRAYPLRIINWHELANDVVGGVPVALAYCTLCSSGILYEAQVGGTVITFRTSGLLYRSNKLMYDVETTTLWNQFTGEPAIGKLVGSGIKLNMLPMTLTTWAEWLSLHPDTRVLDINTGYFRNYASEGEPGAAYNDYFADPELWFPVGQDDDRMWPKTLVFGLELQGHSRAYPIDSLKLNPLLNDKVGDVSVVLITNAEAGAVRAFIRGKVSLQSALDSSSKDLFADDQGGRWRLRESDLVSIEAPERQMEEIPGRTAFWFAWQAYFPQTTIYGQ